MDRRERPHLKKRWLWALLVSLLFHAMLILGLLAGKVFVFPERPGMSSEHSKEIVFDLTPDAARMPREVIRSLSENETPPERPDFLSDRHTVARDEAAAATDGAMPAFEGQTEFSRVFAQSRPSEGEAVSSAPEAVSGQATLPEGFRLSDRPVSRSTFSREKLLGLSNPHAAAPEPAYRNNQSRAAEEGGIRFNTYAWEFAPYMHKLKDRLQRNLYPPSSFTRLGFGGDNLLKFRIFPDGRMQGPAVLQVAGDEALLETSKKAVSLSAPFWPLPDGFPEDYLDVTVHFRYLGLTSP